MMLIRKLTFILLSFIQQLMQDFMAAISNFSAPRIFVYLLKRAIATTVKRLHHLHYHPVNAQSPCSDPVINNNNNYYYYFHQTLVYQTI